MSIYRLPILFVFALFFLQGWSQNSITISASLDAENHVLKIQQEIIFVNSSKDTLNEIYLNDWANSFSSKTSELAKRFAENYDRKFHLADLEMRGQTIIYSISDPESENLQYSRPEGHIDVLRIQLDRLLAPGESRTLKLFYEIRLPNARFTGYGALPNGDYNLRYWCLIPAVYDGEWHFYSNKNLDDLYMVPTDFKITLSLPKSFELITELDKEDKKTSFVYGDTILELKGDARDNVTIYLRQISDFEVIDTDQFSLITNIQNEKVIPEMRALIIDRIAGFLEKDLGSYPYKKLVLSEVDYQYDPVYGLNQLPDFISPFPPGFKYELKILKTAISKFVDKALYVNPRTDRWAADGIKVYLMMRYVERFYPKLKLIGTLDRYWIARQFNISRIEFNDQYNLLYLHMARLNLDQSLITPYDSLIKFNKNIAFSYKAGSGFNYLSEYLNDNIVDSSIQEFYKENKLKLTSSKEFEEILKKNSEKDIDWFFEEYVETRKKIDYKILNLNKRGDSLYIKLRNRRDNTMPIPLYGMRGDSVVSKTWVDGFKDIKQVAIAADSIDRVALNLEGLVPEFNRRNNFRKLNPFLGLHKPLEFRLLQDIEDPSKHQIFFMPIVQYNFYDGLKIGPKVYNKTILTKAFNYKIEPQYGLKSKALTGNLALYYNQNIEEGRLYSVRYGVSATSSSYAPDAFYRRYTPFVTFAFRTDDFRSDKRQFLTVRNVSVERDPSDVIINENPNYSVFNLRYTNSNPGVIDGFTWNTDFEIAKKFSKFSVTAKYRKVFLNNRQFDLRFFGGSFIYNDAREEGDYFSFALDRPTDYLFDYNYYGRSEASGVFSQQLILAEGGFKSKLDQSFGNQWLSTLNASTTLFSFIHAYGDVGLLKNKGDSAKFVYDSGLRAVLVEDYFELFFPVYSSNGWEIAQPNYDEKIRFIVTLDLRTMLGLFTRRWY